MNPCACGFPSIDHWGIFPEGGCVQKGAESCKGFRKAMTAETVMTETGPASAPPPSISEGTETPSSRANVTDSSAEAGKTAANLNAPPATASGERPTQAADQRS